MRPASARAASGSRGCSGAATPASGTRSTLIAAGYSNDQIAAELYVSINTVKPAIRSIYSRLRVRTRTQAVAWAIEHGYATMA